MLNFTLQPQSDSRQSFYNKAKVEIDGNTKTLISYNTKVCIIEGDKARVKGLFSRTTQRHITEFLKQNGFKAENGKQILTDYGKE